MLRKAIPLAIISTLVAVFAYGDGVEQTCVPGEVIVCLRPQAAVGALAALGYAPQTGPTGDYTLLATKSGQTVEAAIDELRTRPEVAYAQPNYLYRAFWRTTNDPSLVNQWQLVSTRLREAWDIDTAVNTTVSGESIAIIDSGEDTGHTDLAARFVYAPACDIIDGDSNPYDDGHSGHGTMTAGIAGATGNNAILQCGTVWNARLMPIRVLTGNPATGTSLDVDSGIRLATRCSATVLNLSFGFSGSSVDNVVEQALTAAVNAGAIVVAATGNTGGRSVLYPASSLKAIAVGATTSANARSSFSSYGAAAGLNGVDVMAPGENLYVLNMGSSESGAQSGTSLAAPQVSGLAALIRSRRPYLNPTQFRVFLRSTATDIGDPGYDDATGAGLVNALRLLQVATANSTYGDSLPNADTRTSSMTTNGRQGQQCVVLASTDSYVGFNARHYANRGVIQFYFRPDTTQASGTLHLVTQRGELAASGGQMDVTMSSTGYLYYKLADSATLTSRTALKGGQWYHLAFSYGDSGMSLWVNGDSEASSGVVGGPPTANVLCLGAPYSLGNAISARGRITNLSFSGTQSLLFPCALTASVEAPATSLYVTDTLNVSWRAIQTETNLITVDVYADSDNSGYDGVRIASGLYNDQQESICLTSTSLTVGNNYYIYVIASDTSTLTWVYPEYASAYSNSVFNYGTPSVVVTPSTGSKSSGCLLTRLGLAAPGWRALRDQALQSTLGRALVWLYYLLLS